MRKNLKLDAAFQKFKESLLHRIFSEESDLVDDLIDLRVDFVFTALTAPSSSRDVEVKKALDNLNKIRNTKKVQDFLKANLYFFTELDRAIFRDMKRAAISRIAGCE